MPDPTTTATDATEPKPTEQKPRCRMITTDGHRCKNPALYEGHLCWPHQHHRHPVLPHPTHVVVPLLEDHASVQLVLSEVVHGLLSKKLDPENARALIYACQVAAATMPRPPRLPSPETPGAPSLSRRPSGATGWESDESHPADSQSELETGNRGLETEPELETGNRGLETEPELKTGNRGLETESELETGDSEESDDDDDMVFRLGLDDQGLICADGEPPAPNARWSPALPGASPIDIIHVAPNQSKPTPRDPEDADTHRCDCPICYEIKKMKGDPMNHPHLQPVVNPYCKKNRAGCEGPGSPTQCSYCEGIYKYAPRKYARVRHTARVPHPWPGDEQPTVRLPGVGTWEETPRGGSSLGGPFKPGVGLSGGTAGPSSELGGPFKPDVGLSGEEEEPVQLLPNPIPEQFPDNDPMLRGRIDLNASASVVLTRNPYPVTPAVEQGNTSRVLPSNSFRMNETDLTATGGYPLITAKPATALRPDRVPSPR